MTSVGMVISLLAVSALWGITNPLLKRASIGIEDINMGNPFMQTVSEIKFLASRLSYVIPFLLNQAGGLLFVYSLGAEDLSLVVPFTNGLTFLVTTVAGFLLGEENMNRTTWIGAVLVCVGIFLCLADKTMQ
ncbi:transmembrane protein 234 homolog [Oratosquilla oratoria]|uniref:transmembrane protein 234 homolog n=1 Tax=Oratosquilla oratoria TaxID=337810 RepID=UPI003F771373